MCVLMCVFGCVYGVYVFDVYVCDFADGYFGYVFWMCLGCLFGCVFVVCVSGLYFGMYLLGLYLLTYV